MENLEDKVLNNQKKTSKKIFYVISGLLVLGIICLVGGIKIFSSILISADSDTPPTPPPIVGTNSPTGDNDPPIPPDPSGPHASINIPAGWSMIAGETLAGRDVSAFSKANIYVFSFNDPSVPNRNWLISEPSFDDPSDFFSITSSIKFWPNPSLGYYVFNPNNAQVLEFPTSSSTRPDGNLIFGRGWHLMYWPGDVQSRDALLSRVAIKYSDGSSEILTDAITDDLHKASLRIYVVVNQNGLNNSSVKELTNTDSSTTISKIPAKSYFWMYLRRTKNRATEISVNPQFTPTATPTTTATISGTTTSVSKPPVPPAPN